MENKPAGEMRDGNQSEFGLKSIARRGLFVLAVGSLLAMVGSAEANKRPKKKSFTGSLPEQAGFKTRKRPATKKKE